MKITNPVLTGFHADPSMIRVKDTYYIANSTFEWFPGIRLHESKDMVHWNTLPYPLGAEQLDMRGDPASGGVWAPDLSYADGRFWIVYSDVHIVNGAFKDVVNYLTTAEDIRGPWSKPLRLNGVGFDASLFHDDDGRKYLVQQTWDHREYKHQFHGITLTEFDTATMRLKPETARTIWMGDDVKLVEGPHLYKINGWYYLFCAEGVYEYSRHARSILHTCVHRGEDGEGYPMWNPENHLIKFIPETEWTDPSYHLPHFYEVFAQRADEADRPFWREAAAASRRYLVTACHPQTGMNPEYSNYDGTPHVDERDHWHFYSDAYRTAGNIGLDCLWNGVVPHLRLRGRRHAGGRDRAAPGRLHRRHRRRLARRDALAGAGRARQRDPLGAPAVGHPDPHRHASLLRQLPLRLRVPGVGGGVPHLVRCRES